MDIRFAIITADRDLLVKGPPGERNVLMTTGVTASIQERLASRLEALKQEFAYRPPLVGRKEADLSGAIDAMIQQAVASVPAILIEMEHELKQQTVGELYTEDGQRVK